MRALLLAVVLLTVPALPAAAAQRRAERPVPGSVVTTATTQDLDAGPPWAVRTWKRPTESPGDGLPAPDLRCLQVGRVVGGRLARTFAMSPARPLALGDRTVCGELETDDVEEAIVVVERLVAEPAATEPRFARTVVAGLAPTAVTALELVVAGTTRSVPIDRPTRAWLAVLPGSVKQTQLALRYTVGGDPRTVDFGASPAFPPEDRYVPGSAAAPLTAPDPAGGLPYGLTTYAVPGRHERCTEPGRVVDGEVGPYEPRFGSFLDGPMLAELPSFEDEWMPHAHRATSISGCVDEPDQPLLGLGWRRMAPGVLVLHGPVRDDVRAVSVALSSGARLRAPVGGGAFLAPVRTTGRRGERATLVAELTSGARRTYRLPVAAHERPATWSAYAVLPRGRGIRVGWTGGFERFTSVVVKRRAGRTVLTVNELFPPPFGPDGVPNGSADIGIEKCVDVAMTVPRVLGDGADRGRRRRQVRRIRAARGRCPRVRPRASR